MKTLACPNCGAQADAGAHNAWRPFCSKRCKLIDLGDWLAEEHRIPGKPADTWQRDDDADNQSRH